MKKIIMVFLSLCISHSSMANFVALVDNGGYTIKENMTPVDPPPVTDLNSGITMRGEVFGLDMIYTYTWGEKPLYKNTKIQNIEIRLDYFNSDVLTDVGGLYTDDPIVNAPDKIYLSVSSSATDGGAVIEFKRKTDSHYTAEKIIKNETGRTLILELAGIEGGYEYFRLEDNL